VRELQALVAPKFSVRGHAGLVINKLSLQDVPKPWVATGLVVGEASAMSLVGRCATVGARFKEQLEIFQNFDLRAKARIWPLLSYMCHMERLGDVACWTLRHGLCPSFLLRSRLELSDTQSLRALNTSPSRNRCTFMCPLPSEGGTT